MAAHLLGTRPAFLDGRPKQLLIDGEWVDAAAGETIDSIDPSTGETLGSVARGTAVDVDRAVRAARRAFEAGPWRRFTTGERSLVLNRLADLIEDNGAEFMHIDAMDMGTPVKFQQFLLGVTLNNLRYAAAKALDLNGATIPNSIPGGQVFTYTLREPVGVVGGIIPWNGPLFQASWKLGAALATGCTLVLKPAEQASFAPLLLGRLSLEAGIPPGVVNVVTGDGEAGAALAEHHDVDKIAFTGSTETGRQVIRASAGNVKKLTLELGGKSPDIVFADADLDEAVPGAAMATFVASGQSCMAGTRLYVERTIFEEFTERVAAFANSLKVGNSLDPDTDLGPLVSAQQLERVTGYLQAGQAAGARALSGGGRLTTDGNASGFFISPTTFVDVDDAMPIAREEIFGPVISAMPFADVDEVVGRANATSYGLASGLWTTNVNTVQRVTKGLQAGTVFVNNYGLADPAVPFGGYKTSGYGRENGHEQYDAYLNTKSIFLKTT
ncbi:aldehyde dehydrogenase family protein [Amycolatopsis jiangsuensis]|uniref:Aldehyde dehydrogenase (NAD+) n=1 Tax=Amycolatopsis jiangsuensis TaxID=1181879 RepID=A0A840J7A4_9PSEU|nr:aldehyde dehydrogenase family protein [Amycolatopsis jiangsuensis]MBB4689663.1 aldehyde dehydrogenase (NAD+) [Amycolatopsis jiangsuensis]